MIAGRRHQVHGARDRAKAREARNCRTDDESASASDPSPEFGMWYHGEW